MRCAHGGHACVAAVFCICFAHWPAAALTAASLPCRPPWPGPAGRNHAAACAAWPPAACMRTDARTHRRIRTITAASHAQTSRRYAAPHAPGHAAPSLGVTRPARCRFSAYHARAGAEYPPRSHSRTAYGPHHARLHKNILRPPAAGCLTAPPCKRRAAARSARHLPQPDGGLRPGHRPRSFPAQRHKTPGHGRPNRLRMRTPVLCRNVRKKYFNYLFLMIFIIFFTQYGIILTIYKSILSFCRSFPLTKRPVIPKKNTACSWRPRTGDSRQQAFVVKKAFWPYGVHAKRASALCAGTLHYGRLSLPFPSAVSGQTAPGTILAGSPMYIRWGD